VEGLEVVARKRHIKRGGGSVGLLEVFWLIVVKEHGKMARSEEVRREAVSAEVLFVPGLRVWESSADYAWCAVPASILTLDGLE
jgi:hypothetical protein